MNVTVFGATGGVGAQTVDQLLANGHTVTAYVRNPAKAPATWGEDVTVVVGELNDATAVDRAVQGADAVVSALGASLDRKAAGLSLVEGTRNIITAMQAQGVRRYVGNGTPSVLDPRERPTWQTRLTKPPTRRVYLGANTHSSVATHDHFDDELTDQWGQELGPETGFNRRGAQRAAGASAPHGPSPPLDLSTCAAGRPKSPRGRAVSPDSQVIPTSMTAPRLG
jgi:nucleoside-diphosphate-sugar epimerase